MASVGSCGKPIRAENRNWKFENRNCSDPREWVCVGSLPCRDGRHFVPTSIFQFPILVFLNCGCAFFLTSEFGALYKGNSGLGRARCCRRLWEKDSTSLGEVTTQTKATAQKLGDEPTGGAGMAGVRLCLKWLSQIARYYVVWSQSSHQEV